ncbi:MAG: hypothetical protein M0Z88_00175 [Actinomycetota bacterium]|nr:hypothetical protein [Actinomycetota bacterium]
MTTLVTCGALPAVEPGDEQLKDGAAVVGGGGGDVVVGATVVVVTGTVVGVTGTVVVGACDGAEAGELAPPTVVVAPAGADVEER